MLSTVFNLISTLLTAYSFIIFIRIIFSWFNLKNGSNGAPQNKIISVLYSITDPYLNWFRRFKFLTVGMLDFSALIAISILYFFRSLTTQIAATGVITLSYVIKLIIYSLWSLASSFAFIVIVLLAIRFVFILLNKHSQIFNAIDGYTEPILRRFSNVFTKKFTSYKTNIIIFISGLILALLIVNIAITFLFKLF